MRLGRDSKFHRIFLSSSKREKGKKNPNPDDFPTEEVNKGNIKIIEGGKKSRRKSKTSKKSHRKSKSSKKSHRKSRRGCR